jgi:hypothetical protein
MAGGLKMNKEPIKATLILLIIAICCGLVLGIIKTLVGQTTTSNEYLQQVFFADNYVLLEADHLYRNDYADILSTYITESTEESKNGMLIIESVGQGFEGSIVMLTAFNMQGEIVGIICKENAETRPSSILDQDTLNKLLGLNKQLTSGDIDGTAGATYTTNGLLSAVNISIEFYNAYSELLRGSI